MKFQRKAEMGTVEILLGSATVVSTCGLIAATIGPAEIEVKADLEKPIWELGAHDVTLTHVRGPAAVGLIHRR